MPLVHSFAPEEGVFRCEAGVDEVTDLSGRVGAALVAVDVDEVDLLLDHLSGRVAGVCRIVWDVQGGCHHFRPTVEGGGAMGGV